MLRAKDRILVALDVNNLNAALDLVDCLKDHVGGFKVGSQLFTAVGPEVITEINRLNARRVFLDLKWLDIPTTVRAATEVAATKDVWMMTVHGIGGGEMMYAAWRGVEEGHKKKGTGIPPLIVAVTVLSSQRTVLDGYDVPAIDSRNLVEQICCEAMENYLDGVVVQPNYLSTAREYMGDNGIIVCPGVRLSGEVDDHVATIPPGKAIELGADYVVIGRPITQHEIGSTAMLSAVEAAVSSICKVTGEDKAERK